MLDACFAIWRRLLIFICLAITSGGYSYLAFVVGFVTAGSSIVVEDAIAAGSATEIQAVRVWRAPDHTRLVLDLSERADYTMFTLGNPLRIVVDIKSGKLKTDLDAIVLDGTPVKKLRGAAKSGGKYRLVLDMLDKVRPNAFLLAANQQYGDRLVIDLYDSQKKSTVVKTVEQNQGKRDLIIVIDPGHGGEDPGALGPRKVREKDVVLSIARKLKNLIDNTTGFRGVLTRDGDYYVSLSKRRNIARKAKADLFLSIHADAFKDKRVSGSSVYTLSQHGASSTSAQFLADAENKSDRIGGVDLSDKDDLLTSVLLDLSMTATLDSSVRVAKEMLTEMDYISKLHKRTVEHAGFAVLKSPDVPSVLIETGFISNAKEAARLSSPSHQQNLAEAIFDGVVSYYNNNAIEGTWVYWNKKQGGKPIASARKQGERQYKVKGGDTLSEVAVKYSVSLNELRRYNKLRSDKIRVGQIIKIPPQT